MKVDVKHAKDGGTWDGSSISIESGDSVSIVQDAKYVGIHTNNTPEFDDHDELWIFKRKAFLKAVAKALNVVIYELDADANIALDDPGYYQ